MITKRAFMRSALLNKLRAHWWTVSGTSKRWTVNWNTSKGNQVPIQKFERPNLKIPKSKILFYLGQELVPPANLKAQWGDFSEDFNQIKTNQNKKQTSKNLLLFTTAIKQNHRWPRLAEMKNSLHLQRLNLTRLNLVVEI